MSKADLEKQLVDAEIVVKNLREQLGTKKANTMFRCVACKGIHKISSCDAYAPMHYNSAAYEEGWEHSEELWAICPKTGIANRFLIHDDYDTRIAHKGAGRAFYWEYQDKFKSLTSTMRGSYTRGDEHKLEWINNDYIDKNRKKFGLPEKPRKS
jgi:hypothetical protein